MGGLHNAPSEAKRAAGREDGGALGWVSLVASAEASLVREAQAASGRSDGGGGGPLETLIALPLDCFEPSRPSSL